MKPHHFYAYVLLCAALSVGCAGFTQTIGFETSLEEVERPADASVQYGPISVEAVGDEGEVRQSFVDSMITASFLVGEKSISLVIENMTDYTMKINWDDAAYVAPTGESMRIIHAGTKLVDKNAPQAPSIIVRRGKLTDTIVPADHVSYTTTSGGGWHYRELLYRSNVYATEMSVELEKSQQVVGQTFSLLLPLEIEGIVNDYLFVFQVESAEITKREDPWSDPEIVMAVALIAGGASIPLMLLMLLLI